MNNLFRAFEPTALFGLSLNWASSLTLFLFVPARRFLATSRGREVVFLGLKRLSLEFSSVFGALVKPGRVWFVVSIFFFIFLNNILGLFPYIFTRTSHIRFGLRLAFPIWVGHMAYSWIKQPQYALAHLVPLGTPPALMSFIVLIELVRNVIRPITLRVRLIANLTAGHLLLCLLRSNLRLELLSPGAIAVLSGLCLLIVLEVAVSLIQAYVFTLLTRLYLEEVQTVALVK